MIWDNTTYVEIRAWHNSCTTLKCTNGSMWFGTQFSQNLKDKRNLLWKCMALVTKIRWFSITIHTDRLSERELMNWLKHPLKAQCDNWMQSYWSSTYFWKKDGEHKVFYCPKPCVFTNILILYLNLLQRWWYVCNDSKYCSYSSSSRERAMVKLANLMLVQANISCNKRQH